MRIEIPALEQSSYVALDVKTSYLTGQAPSDAELTVHNFLTGETAKVRLDYNAMYNLAKILETAKSNLVARTE